MRELLRRYWVLVPMLASLATQCDETPRGAIPTMITSANLVLNSVPAETPEDPAALDALAICLQRMDGLPNHVRPSWRANQPVLFAETTDNVWAVTFFDVPVENTLTMTVHDQNECVRDPTGNGHVAMGVTVNGTVVDTVVGTERTLVFQMAADGTVRLPNVAPPAQ